jgi:hypothetical protein
MSKSRLDLASPRAQASVVAPAILLWVLRPELPNRPRKTRPAIHLGHWESFFYERGADGTSVSQSWLVFF